MKKQLLLTCFIFLSALPSFSQTISVGTYAEGIARMDQILGVGNDISSFCIRPVNSAFGGKGDSSLINMVAGKSLLPKFNLLGIPSGIKILPFTWLNDYNSKLPYGYNNGPLYPNVGYQTMITGGILIKAGMLNVQFKPEMVHAQNSQFLTFANVQGNYNSSIIPAFFTVVNGIDAPERFGPYGLSYAGWGQSKITMEFKHVEAGISTENLWWGPGVQNSILMSNSAPGFVHWTFNSSNPVKTIIGSFEWQLIGGVLKQSGYFPYDAGPLARYSGMYVPKPVVSRYLSAFTVNWQPKWIDGLYLGVSAVDYTNRDAAYNSNSFLNRTVPVFHLSSNADNSALGSKGVGVGDNQDFLYSAYLRQVLTKYNAEIYFEFARNDQAANFRDFVLEPEHSSAYTVGGRRLFALSEKQFLQVIIELTHLQLPDTFLFRNEQSFYVHSSDPRDGYTNEGRYLGAGIGPGSNSLMIDASYIRKQNSIGIKFERYVHNNDMYYFAFANTPNFVSHWVDFSTTFYANVKFKKYLISAQYVPVTVLNYEYLQKDDISNKHARVTLTYFFD